MERPLHVAEWVVEKYVRIIDAVWGGEHHLKRYKWHKTELQVWLHGSLSTFDYSGMTRLVVVCHDECVRGEVMSERGLSVLLSVRDEHPEAPHGATRGHPKLERHIVVIREMIATGNSSAPIQKLYRELESPCPT